MKFSSEAKRLEHPQAGLIPGALWNSDRMFGSEIDDDELAMMTIDLATMDDLPIARSWAAPLQLRSCLCLLLGHPGASVADLLLAAQVLSLPSDIVFKGAILANRPDIVDAIKTDTREIRRVISDDSYFVFRQASALGYLASLIRLTRVAPELKIAMIAAANYQAFRYAAANGHLAVAQYLLSSPPCFAYAEAHDDLYGEGFVHPFVQAKLTSLGSQRLAAEAANAHVVFDTEDADDPQRCFYIIRYLIRRNDHALLDDIRFLLQIPAVRRLAHQPVTAGQPNELVRLALTTGNRVAADILLNIRAVGELAKYDNYYRDEVRARLDLDALVRDCESSVHVLSSGEQTRLAVMIEHYQPIMRAVGVDDLFKHLRETLVARYKKHPATIIIDSVTIALPVDWETFTHLVLSKAQRKDALKAYYQHKEHSALRYISRPNPWMAADANYIYKNIDTRESWSTFEEYKALIAMLWLAVRDETKVPTDGFTLEGRITHFMGGLARLARAHNLGRRIIAGGSGAPLFRRDGHASKEYDDLAGDKPSYYFQRDPIQLVVGHPLLKILTKDDIKKELDDFVRAHFTCLITDKNRERLLEAWNTYSATMDLGDANPLKTLNISVEQRVEFVLRLTAKYGRQFSDNASFGRIIEEAFTLVNSGSNPSGSLHALKFERLVNLGDLLQAPTMSALASAVPAARGGAGAPGAIGFFPEGPAERYDAPAVNCCVVQ